MPTLSEMISSELQEQYADEMDGKLREAIRDLAKAEERATWMRTHTRDGCIPPLSDVEMALEYVRDAQQALTDLLLDFAKMQEAHISKGGSL